MSGHGRGGRPGDRHDQRDDRHCDRGQGNRHYAILAEHFLITSRRAIRGTAGMFGLTYAVPARHLRA